jgi:anti-anti-sigma factor
VLGLPAGRQDSYDGGVTAAQLNVASTRTDEEAVLLLSGEIDMSTADLLRIAASSMLVDAPARVVLDFAGVTFCDSRGLSVLIGLSREARRAGTHLVVANVGEFVGDLLDLTGLRAAFEVIDAK